MFRRVLVLIALLAAAVSTGCSNPAEPPGDYDPAAVRDGLGALFAGDHPETRDTAAGACFAKELTSTTSPRELREAGVLDERFDVVASLPVLSPAMAQAWVDAQFACTDFVAESTRAQVKVTKGRLSPAAYAACLESRLSEQELRTAVAASLVGDFDDEAVARLARAQADCAAEARGGSDDP